MFNFKRKYNVLFQVKDEDGAYVDSFNLIVDELPTLGHDYIVDSDIFTKVTRVVNLAWDYRQKGIKALLNDNTTPLTNKFDYFVSLSITSHCKFNGNCYYEYR